MPKCRLSNVDIFYEIVGDGEPIVFTHGASWNHKQWQPQVECFSKYYQVVVWDVRGHGCSSLPPGKVDPEEFNKDLIGLLNHLNIEKASLCGLSMGGHISLQTAIRYPERVNSLILIGTPFTNTFNWYEKVFIPINRWSNRLIPKELNGRIQAKMLSKFNRNNKQYIEEAVSQIPHRNWIRIWDAVSKMESKDDLGRVNCPTLILLGDRDTMIKQQEYMNSEIKNSKLEIIKNAHHATNLDNPQDVNKSIHNFILGIGGWRSGE